ncbi:response regulator [Nitratireductor mangrovi]|nr:response regulator [Nitratireductor mangrovi]
MSSKITRAYMRGRLYVVLTGFVVAIAAGTGIMLWQAERAKTDVKFGAVIAYMADATSDVLYHSLRLDNTRIAPPQDISNNVDGSTPAARKIEPTKPTASKELVAQIRSDLDAALARLADANDALQLAVEGDVNMGESKMITAAEQAGGADTGRYDNATLASIAGLTPPASVAAIWIGDDNQHSLKRDVKEVLTHADRLAIFRDLTQPVAQRVFKQLKTLANDRVRPNLSRTLHELHNEMTGTYGTLQFTLLLVAVTIISAGGLLALRVFDPMMRNIQAAHENLRQAKETVEEAKVKAESADRAKSEFLANMSHEIRTPMNGVLGMAELLSRSELDKRQGMFVDVILKSGNALLTIINDILDFSKIDAGQLELDPAPFRLGEAIEDVATLVSARVAEKDLELIVRVDPTLPSTVVGDVGRFRQIATNLVGNAVKFTEKGHVLVDVSGEERDGVLQVTVRVEDTGIGIPADKLASVFDKFAQVDASSTRRHEGTGLGLAIASRLIELMEGEISAESVLGKGSTFWFTVPLPVDESGYGEKPVPFDVSGSRILIVDDNPINRDILVEQLRSWGFDCAAVESGATALAFLSRATELGSHVDGVILDFQMPGMNGAETARAITSDPRTARMPIVLLTSVDQSEIGRLAAECGVSAQLHKPARSSALLETLVSVLQSSKASSAPLEVKANPIPFPTPQRPRPAPVAERRISAASLREPASLDVLVAEDNEVNQLVFSQILDGLGVSYRIAGNGRTAVDMNRALKPKIILMDVSMPEMNGLEATRTIREAEADTGHRTPIIGITAHALKGDREKCLEAGMDDYLSKPVSPNKLSVKIETWLGGGEMARTA